MNTKRKNNNYKTVINDKKNNTYAIVLCVLIFFWTIASFLGTIAFFRSFNDDDTLVASADTAVSSRVADIDMSHFTVEQFGNFQIPLMSYLCYYEYDSIYNPTRQYYIVFEENIPVGISYNSGFSNGYISYDEGDVLVSLQDSSNDEYDLIFETPLWEDGYEYWTDFFEGAIYVESLNSMYIDEPNLEFSYSFVGYTINLGSTNSESIFYIRIYNDVHGFNVEEFFDDYDLAFYNQIGSYANYSKWLEGYNAGYTGTLTDIHNARQEGYNQGYADGLNKNKYGPFSNMIVSIGFNNLFDQDGDSLATGWNDEFRSADIPNALYSIGFNADRFYNDYVYPTILAEFEDYDTFDDTSIIFDFTGEQFSANTYPFRFYLDSLADETPVRVRYVDRTEVSYYFIANTDEGGNTYYTLPFDVSKSIDWFTITLYGGQDILSSLSISVYGQAYQEGFNAGSSVGYNNGFTVGKDIGYEQGSTAGYNNGFNDGKDVGYEEGYYGGYNNGVHKGFLDGVESANEYSFLGLLTSVVDAPLKVFYDMFDFEILGYNMSSFFLALLSICIVIAVVKIILAR